jgi:hypothetical protein
METTTFTDIPEFIRLSARETKTDILLFRGQDCDKPLLPKIARNDRSRNTAKTEREMLEELRRIGASLVPESEDDWDLLGRAQHFGLATRLLDWTSNPLVALWFACCNPDPHRNGYVYLLLGLAKGDLLNKAEHKSPFSTPRTLVYRPALRNPRIAAQSGWFTLHSFSRGSSSFVPLEKNKYHKEGLVRIDIEARHRALILEDLDQYGINHLALFPDLSGVCNHINWRHDVTRSNTSRNTDPQARSPK